MWRVAFAGFLLFPIPCWLNPVSMAYVFGLSIRWFGGSMWRRLRWLSPVLVAQSSGRSLNLAVRWPSLRCLGGLCAFVFGRVAGVSGFVSLDLPLSAVGICRRWCNCMEHGLMHHLCSLRQAPSTTTTTTIDPATSAACRLRRCKDSPDSDKPRLYFEAFRTTAPTRCLDVPHSSSSIRKHKVHRRVSC